MPAPMKLLVALCLLLIAQPAIALPKVLCLHGGGQSASSFQSDMSDITSTLSGTYEFYFPQSPDPPGNSVWVADPPGGKGEPTNDPNWASDSVTSLNSYIATNGPFVGIVGYSQGSMFTTYMVAASPANTFSWAVMFCGYLPETHLGLLSTINTASPFNDIPSLVFMATNDGVITNTQTDGQAAKFTNPQRETSSTAGHAPPGNSDSTFSNVVSWMRARATPTPTPLPMPVSGATTCPANICTNAKRNPLASQPTTCASSPCTVDECCEAATTPGNGQTFTCQEIKTAFQQQQCCNNLATGTFTLPQNRRQVNTASDWAMIKKLETLNVLLKQDLLSQQEHDAKKALLLQKFLLL